jgi:hypothetical protein
MYTETNAMNKPQRHASRQAGEYICHTPFILANPSPRIFCHDNRYATKHHIYDKIKYDGCVDIVSNRHTFWERKFLGWKKLSDGKRHVHT